MSGSLSWCAPLNSEHRGGSSRSKTGYCPRLLRELWAHASQTSSNAWSRDTCSPEEPVPDLRHSLSSQISFGSNLDFAPRESPPFITGLIGIGCGLWVSASALLTVGICAIVLTHTDTSVDHHRPLVANDTVAHDCPCSCSAASHNGGRHHLPELQKMPRLKPLSLLPLLPPLLPGALGLQSGSVKTLPAEPLPRLPHFPASPVPFSRQQQQPFSHCSHHGSHRWCRSQRMPVQSSLELPSGFHHSGVAPLSTNLWWHLPPSIITCALRVMSAPSAQVGAPMQKACCGHNTQLGSVNVGTAMAPRPQPILAPLAQAQGLRRRTSHFSCVTYLTTGRRWSTMESGLIGGCSGIYCGIMA
jgi:hypothetical protein